MSIEKRIDKLELKVDFPVNKSSSIGFGEKQGILIKPTIGGDVRLAIGTKTLAIISYHEELTTHFTFEGYEQRAKDHAESVVAKIVGAATEEQDNTLKRAMEKAAKAGAEMAIEQVRKDFCNRGPLRRLID